MVKKRKGIGDREWMVLTCTVVVFIMVCETCLGQRGQDDEPLDDTHRVEGMSDVKHKL